MVQVIRSFLWDLRRWLKQIFFWKRANFSVKKCICPILFRIFEFDKPQKTIHKSQKDILTIIVKVIKVFLGPERLLKTQTFEKKCTFPVNKCICPIFSQIVACVKPQKTFYRGQKDNLTITVVVIRSFFRT